MKIGIIGYGNFGGLLEKLAPIYLSQADIMIFAPDVKPDGKTFFSFEEVCATDALILAVPMSAFREVLEKAEKHMRPDTIVVDVSTVKRHPVDALRSTPLRPFLAMHPMFGPESYKKVGSLAGLRVVLSDHTISESLYVRIQEEMRNLGLNVIEMDADTHDKLLAETLFVTHLIGQTMKQAGFVRTTVDTVSFGFLMDAVESVANDTALFLDVWRYNQYCTDVLQRFDAAVAEVKESLE